MQWHGKEREIVYRVIREYKIQNQRNKKKLNHTQHLIKDLRQKSYMTRAFAVLMKVTNPVKYGSCACASPAQCLFIMRI